MALINSNDILEYVLKMSEKGVDAIDALMTYAHENQIELEVVGEICADNPNLLAILEETAEGFNLLDKKDRLTFDE